MTERQLRKWEHRRAKGRLAHAIGAAGRFGLFFMLFGVIASPRWLGGASPVSLAVAAAGGSVAVALLAWFEWSYRELQYALATNALRAPR
jgi:hypothetical protein